MSDAENNAGLQQLSPEEKRKQLYIKQKNLLEMFLERGAISKAQFDKSLGDLTEKMGTEGNKTLGVGIKHEYLKWCKDSNVNGYNVKFTDTVVNFNGVAGSLTFTGKTDGNKNLMIMARTLDNTQGTENDTGLSEKLKGG